jgi:hypothetical protein
VSPSCAHRRRDCRTPVTPRAAARPRRSGHDTALWKPQRPARNRRHGTPSNHRPLPARAHRRANRPRAELPATATQPLSPLALWLWGRVLVVVLAVAVLAGEWPGGRRGVAPTVRSPLPAGAGAGAGLVAHAGRAGPESNPRVVVNGKVTPPRQRNGDVRTREHLTPGEVDRLMGAAGRLGRHSHRDATLVLLAYRHGLRVSVLVALRWDQSLCSQCTGLPASLPADPPSVRGMAVTW